MPPKKSTGPKLVTDAPDDGAWTGAQFLARALETDVLCSAYFAGFQARAVPVLHPPCGQEGCPDEPHRVEAEALAALFVGDPAAWVADPDAYERIERFSRESLDVWALWPARELVERVLSLDVSVARPFASLAESLGKAAARRVAAPGILLACTYALASRGWQDGLAFRAHPLFDRDLRKVRVSLMDDLRKAHPTLDWALAARAGMAAWDDAVPDLFLRTLQMYEQLLRDWDTAEQAAQVAEKARDALESRLAKAEAALSDAPLAKAEKQWTREREQLEARTRAALDEAQGARLARDEATAKATRALARIERLEGERDHLLARLGEVELELRGLRPEPAEPAPPEAVAIEPEPVDPAALAGRTVYVFTNQERGAVRAQFAQSFRDWGAAEATTFHTSSDLGPETFPAEALVVVDLTFMPHNHSDILKWRAQASGAWFFQAKHGVARLAREAVAAWRAGAGR